MGGRWLVVSAVLFLILAVEAAEEPPRGAAAAAEWAVARSAAGDEAALARLATTLAPDPWLVADELCAQGQYDVAAQLAAAGNDARTEGLAAFVAARRENPTTPEARARFARDLGWMRSGQAARALEDLAGLAEGPDDVISIRLHHALANLLRDSGDLAGAAEVYAATAARAHRMRWWFREADLMHVSAEMAFRAGDPNAAIRRWEVSRVAFERIGHWAALGQTCTNLGTLLTRTGDLRAAEERHEEAIRAYRRIGNARGVGENLARLGHVHLRRGEYAQALTLYEEAATEAAAAKDRREQARAWQSAGSVYSRLGDYERARELEEKALVVYRELGQTGPEILAILTLASLERSRGDIDASDERTREALDLCRKSGEEEKTTLALGGLAENLRRRGDWKKAAGAYDAVLERVGADGDRQMRAWARGGRVRVSLMLGEVDVADRHADAAVDAAKALGGADLARALEARVRVRLAQGRVAEALDAARESVACASETTEDLSTVEAALGRQSLAGIFDTALAAGLASGDPREVFRFLEAGRAGALVGAIGGREALERAEDPPELADEMKAAQAAVGEASASLAAAKATNRRHEIREATSAYEAARTARARLLERAERRRKILAGVAPRSIQDLPACRASLGADRALVLYGSTSGRTVALVVTKEEARIVALGATAELAPLAAALRADDPGSDPAAAVAALRRKIVAPLGLSASLRTVSISPSGDLATVPFSLLLPDRVLSFLPSATALAVLRGESRGGSDGVFAIGDPRLDPPGETPVARRVALGPLPGARIEARAVGTVVLLGEDASEAAVRKRLRRESGPWRAVHFACHGLVDSDHPLLSSLVLAPGGGEDGLLTGLEVVTNGVDAELAVLSACGSGRGRVFRGEGLLGLSTAFMLAGCPRVLASLWDVPDEATVRLMSEFYAAWGEDGVGAAEALRRAQAIVRADPRWKHPAYWAGWVLWGPPR